MFVHGKIVIGGGFTTLSPNGTAAVARIVLMRSKGRGRLWLHRPVEGSCNRPLRILEKTDAVCSDQHYAHVGPGAEDSYRTLDWPGRIRAPRHCQGRIW